MDNNPYAAPDSEITADPVPVRQRFYVVAPTKFFLLFFTTLGAYQLYWNYKNWAQFKQVQRSDEWPVMRSIFSVFFTHSLFREIDKELIMTQNKYAWSPDLNASFIVILLIGTRIISRLSSMSGDEDGSMTDIVLLLVIPALSYFYYQAQIAANEACGDPKGLTNANYSAANIIWIVLGSLFLIALLFGVFVILFEGA